MFENANVVYAPYTFWRGSNETILRRLFTDGFIFRFIRSNIKNNDYFDAIQEIYSHFKYLETYSFSDIFIRRIRKKNVVDLLNRIYDSEKRKRIVLLTDIDSGIKGYTCIDKTDIAAFPGKENYIFIPVYEKDWLAREALAELTVYGLRYHFLPLWEYPSTRFSLTDQITYETLKDEMNNNPKGHYSPTDYENISQALLATKNLQGAYVEIGVYQGDSARYALNYMKRSSISRNAYFIDAFEGFTHEQAAVSENTGWENTHTDTSMKDVKDYLSGFPGAILIKGNIIADDLPAEIDKIALCNIDVDMYEAIKAALYKTCDLITTNGIIIVQDYGGTPALIGAQKAVHEFLEEQSDKFISLYMTSRQLFLIKRGEAT